MRLNYSEEENYPGQFELWQANCRRSLQGNQGQVALRELEAALLALPDKRLIADKLIDAEGEVCAIGALARFKGRDFVAETREQLTEIGIDNFDDEIDGDGEMEEIGVELGMPRLVAWKVVERNDICCSHVTPEKRYEQVLAWVQGQLKTPAAQLQQV